MGYHFLFKTTDGFSLLEKEQFCELFAHVFSKTLSSAEFDRKYLCTPLGYSHHGLMFADNVLVGTYNLVPYAYNYFGTQVLFGLSVDSMIKEEHRGRLFSLPHMARMAEKAAAQDGVVFLFGFPNQSVCQFTRRVLGWADVGKLNFYVFPWNLGAIRPWLGWSNLLSRIAMRGILFLPRTTRQMRGGFGIEKISDSCFDRHRYADEHNIIDLPGGGKCVYRVYAEDNSVRVAFLIDVAPLIPECFVAAVRTVFRTTAKHADLLLYVGRLPFHPKVCIRVPLSWEPRQIMMCGKVLRHGIIDERVLDIDNWNVNLSNFDVR